MDRIPTEPNKFTSNVLVLAGSCPTVSMVSFGSYRFPTSNMPVDTEEYQAFGLMCLTIAL